MTRTYSRRTISLSPEADEALERIMALDSETKASRVVDRLLRAEMVRRGFYLSQAEESSMDITITTPRGNLPFSHQVGLRYIQAVPGESYTITLHNRSGVRQLAVLSVDGLNTIDGSDADYNGRGWVVPAHGSVTIDGWKLDNKKAAAFTFGGKDASYAAQSGKGTQNVGVIGAAVFNEKRVTRTPDFWMSQMSWSSGGGTYGSTAKGTTRGAPTKTSSSVTRGATGQSVNTSSSVGTQFGQKIDMATTTTTFERATQAPAEVLAIHYGTAEDLQAWGVPLPVAIPSPSPFPGEGCTPPAGWRG